MRYENYLTEIGAAAGSVSTLRHGVTSEAEEQRFIELLASLPANEQLSSLYDEMTFEQGEWRAVTDDVFIAIGLVAAIAVCPLLIKLACIELDDRNNKKMTAEAERRVHLTECLVRIGYPPKKAAHVIEKMFAGIRMGSLAVYDYVKLLQGARARAIARPNNFD